MKNLLQLWKNYSFILLLIFLVAGLFDFRFALAAVICMAAPILVSLFKGRFWCGNICPRGNFYDKVVSRFARKHKVPGWIKSYYFRGIVFVAMMTMFAMGIRKNWGSLSGIGFVFYRMILVTTILGIVLSFLYNHRTWCNFCPMGTVASLISRFKKHTNVLKVSDGCVSCKICEKKCSLGIVPYAYKGDILNHPDCIQCGKCVSVCPKNAIGYEM